MALRTASVRRRISVVRVFAGVVGALVGFGVAFLLYSSLNPILEARTDWIRELQGLLFNTVPLGAVVGAVIGWRLSRPRSKGSQRPMNSVSGDETIGS